MVKYGSEIYIYGGSIMDFERPHEDIIVFNTSKIKNKLFIFKLIFFSYSK